MESKGGEIGVKFDFPPVSDTLGQALIAFRSRGIGVRVDTENICKELGAALVLVRGIVYINQELSKAEAVVSLLKLLFQMSKGERALVTIEEAMRAGEEEAGLFRLACAFTPMPEYGRSWNPLPKSVQYMEVNDGGTPAQIAEKKRPAHGGKRGGGARDRASESPAPTGGNVREDSTAPGHMGAK